MSDQSKPDEAEAGSKDGKPTFSRRAFLGVGAVGLISATGLAFAQRNGTNTTNASGNGGRGQQNGSQSSTGTDSNGSESENDGGNDKNERDEQNGKNGKNERNDGGEGKDTGEKTDKDEVKPSQVSLSAKQARNVAKKRVNGTVQSTDLGNQNGTPAYEVTVKTGGGSTKEVAVDANHGTVLTVGAAD